MILKKIAFFVISFILLFTLTVGCDQATQKETSKETPTPQNTDTSKANNGTSSNEEWQAVTVKVSGMTWGAGCPPAVVTALDSLPWSKDTKVDFKNKTATVMVEKSKYKQEDLLKAFEGTRFKGTIEQ